MRARHNLGARPQSRSHAPCVAPELFVHLPPVQVCGGYPDTLARTAQLIDENICVDFVDVNMGQCAEGCREGRLAEAEGP